MRGSKKMTTTFQQLKHKSVVLPWYAINPRSHLKFFWDFVIVLIVLYFQTVMPYRYFIVSLQYSNRFEEWLFCSFHRDGIYLM
mgnify:FL=1